MQFPWSLGNFKGVFIGRAASTTQHIPCDTMLAGIPCYISGNVMITKMAPAFQNGVRLRKFYFVENVQPGQAKSKVKAKRIRCDTRKHFCMFLFSRSTKLLFH